MDRIAKPGRMSHKSHLAVRRVEEKIPVAQVRGYLGVQQLIPGRQSDPDCEGAILIGGTIHILDVHVGGSRDSTNVGVNEKVDDA
jgi:hypothetical protein